MMKKQKFILKPFLTLIVILLIILVIGYIEYKKPKLSRPQTESSTNNEKDSLYEKAPDFVGIENWINSEPLSITELKGKVVLVDFWTYTCINCVRTLPYLREWDEKYKDKGLVIVGVHTPEFEFEKKYDNVLKAVNEYELKYPVAQDNEYATWNSYQNRYWPHKYLIDIDGYIRYDHIGEGNYEETEKMIQLLLKERMNQEENLTLDISNPQDVVDVNYLGIKTPEIYLGYGFSRGNFGNEEGIKANEIVSYKIPEKISKNQVYLSGEWKNNLDNMELVSDEGEILLKYQAKTVNIVAGSENGSNLNVYLDNSLLNNYDIKEFKLYNIDSAQDYGEYTLNIKINGKGFKIYTFTFG